MRRLQLLLTGILIVSLLAFVPLASAGEHKGGKRAHKPGQKHAHKANHPRDHKPDGKRDGKPGEPGRQQAVDNREDRQSRRIDHGVANGSLTPDELKKLKAQQDSIAAMEQSFRGDGKLSRSEFHQLQEQLNTASRCIFAEKHDGEGFTMPVYRLGKNIKLQPGIAQQLANPEMNKSDARQFSKDFHRLLSLKHQLAAGNLDGATRTRLQASYNELLNKYFVAS